MTVETQENVVVRDTRSGAVIIKRNGVFYYVPGRSQQAVKESEITPDEIIVKYKDSQLETQDLNSIAKKVSKFTAKTNPLNSELGLALVKLSKQQTYFEAIKALAQDPKVEYAEPNYIARILSIPNDPYYGRQWGDPAIRADVAWDKVSPAQRAGVTIAVLDTGINPIHEDLQASIVPGFNMVNNNSDTTDRNGHGTHVAGIAAAVGNNGRGVAGVAGGSKIMPVKVMGDNGTGGMSYVINGIKYAVDRGAKVINLSLGSTGVSQAMQDAVNYALNRGVVVVAASGNQNGPVGLPGNNQGVVTVGAVDSSGARASYSNYGPELDVMAPGSQIYSSYIGSASNYTYLSGTSMATPFVAGVSALVKAANPSLTSAQVLNILQRTAKDLGTPGFDNYTGYGLVDASRAVDLALGTSPTPAPTPSPSPNPIPSPSPNPIPSPSPNPSPSPSPAPIPTPGNLALGKPAVASSAAGTTVTADKAFDGNSTSTWWASRPGIDPQWIYVDLGKISTLNKIVLKWGQEYARAYQIQVSNDGYSWYTVYSTTAGMGGNITLTGTVTGRYVRVYGTQRGTVYGYSLWEFEVYGL